MTSTTNQPAFNLSKKQLSQQLIKLLDLNISLIDIINDKAILVLILLLHNNCGNTTLANIETQ